MTRLMTPRERMWAAIKSQPDDFNKASLQKACKPLGIGFVKNYVHSLEKAGYVERIGSISGKAESTSRYRLVKPQHAAPRLTRTGEQMPGCIYQAMWACMKVLKRFSYHDVARAATLDDFVVSHLTAKNYVEKLAMAGYLSVVRQAKRGLGGTPAFYMLARNTGPEAPVITTSVVVLDRNNGDVHLAKTPQEVCDGIEG